MVGKVTLSIALVFLAMVFDSVVTNQVLPQYQEEVGVNQLHSNEVAALTRSDDWLQHVPVLGYLVAFVGIFLLFRRSLMGLLKSVGILGIVLFMSGCRPYMEPIYVEIDTNEVPFVMNLEEVTDTDSQESITTQDKQEMLKKQLVQSRRIEIGQKWKSTGRMWFSGEYIPNQRVVVVNTTPETREWRPSNAKGTGGDQGIWVESSDSVGFSTGISVTARIEDFDASVLFLSNYAPQERRVVNKAGSQEKLFEVHVTSLEQIMDQEIRTKVQEIFADEAAKYPMDELRTMKNEIMATVRKEVVPYFEERGVSITTIGQFGGFTYENPRIQEAIDEVFAAQQDEEVAKAEAKAAEQRKSALQLEGEGEAAKILEARRGEAEGIKLVADAKEYELQKLNENPEAYIKLKQLELLSEVVEKWQGEVPRAIFGGQAELLVNPESLLK